MTQRKNSEHLDSMYARYKEEYENVFTVSNEYGFANYSIEEKDDDFCKIYIQEIYVSPNVRGIKKAHDLADLCIVDAELKTNCIVNTLFGSVSFKSKDPIPSMKTILSYGYKLYKIEGEIIYFYKEI